jgi:excisionase family DNA binding protein
MINRPTRFSFLDEGEALRTLGVDRDTLLALVKEGRLRAYRGFGTGSFFRTSDLEALYAELRGDELAAAEAEAETGSGEAQGTRKVFDPAYKVHVRLQADLKWYDLDDDDLRAWVREMTPDGYTRQRTNVTRVVERLQRLMQLMDEAAAGWQHLAPAGQTGPAVEKKTRRPLPMATLAPQAQSLAQPQAPATPATPATAEEPPKNEPPARRARKPLPMAGEFTPPPPRVPGES